MTGLRRSLVGFEPGGTVAHVDIAELVEIALANSGARRVEVPALEPADVSMQAVSGLAQLLAELVDNAVAFSEPDDTVRITGLFQEGDYLLSISDRGVGIPEHLITELNRLLEDPRAESGPEPRMGISLVARLASRHGIAVRLVPGVPGTTARVTVPAALVSIPEVAAEPPAPPAPSDHRLPARRQVGVASPAGPGIDVGSGHTTVDLSHFERDLSSHTGVVAMSDELRQEAEAFLERVFSPLVKRPGMTERPAPRSSANGNGVARRPETRSEPAVAPPRAGTVTPLRVRVPGQNFSVVEDEQSTRAAEGAIDIRSALSKYEQGRRRASEDDRDQP